MARSKEIGLTAAAQIAKGYAEEAALRHGSAQIGTEHWLLGITHSPIVERGLRAANMHFDNATIRGTVDLLIAGKTTSSLTNNQPLEFTQRSKRAIGLAMDNARLSKSPKVGLADLLIGLVAEKEGIAATVLQTRGITEEQLVTNGAIAQVRRAELVAQRGTLIEFDGSRTIPMFDAEHEIPRFDVLHRRYGADFAAYTLGRTMTAIPFMEVKFDESIQDRYLATLLELQGLVEEVQKKSTLSRRFAQGVLHELQSRGTGINRVR